jgi:siroheme decarboxylase
MRDDIDRALILATQAGLPLVPRPYAVLAAQVGTSETEIIARLTRALDTGAIRRIGAIPNHYALGLAANGMSVFDVDDCEVDRVGEMVGALDCVTHCYRRPRHGVDWPYNLFAMVHGTTRDEVRAQVGVIAARIGAACRGHDILFSTRLLKKTGLRLAA